MVTFLLKAYRISVRRGCGLLMQSRTVYQWQSRRDDRAITVVDNFSRECLASHAGKSLKGEDVVRIMEALRVPDKRVPVRI